MTLSCFGSGKRKKEMREASEHGENKYSLIRANIRNKFAIRD